MDLNWLLSRWQELSRALNLQSLPPFVWPLFVGSAAVGAALALLYVLFVWRRDSTRFLKGPRGWPLIGSIRFGKRGLEDLEKFAHDWGELGALRVLSRSFVVLSSFRTFKEAMLSRTRGDQMTGRPVSKMRRTYPPHGHLGVLFSEGPLWVEQRRFTLHTLRNFGFGNEGAEDATLYELAQLVEFLRDQTRAPGSSKGVSAPIDLRFKMNVAVANVICTLVFGERLASEDPEFEKIFDLMINKVMKFSHNSFAAFFAGVLRKLPGDLFGLKIFYQHMQIIHDFITKKIEQHRATVDPHNVRDYIDAYLIEMERRKDEPPGSHFFFDDQLRHSLVDLFMAGQETTTNVMLWALLCLAREPRVQRSVHREIDERVGRDRAVRYADRALLPYCDSVVNEVLRVASVVWLTQRKSLGPRPVELFGHTFPVGTQFFGNVFHVLHDEKVWPDALGFNPEANFPIEEKAANGHATNANEANGTSDEPLDEATPKSSLNKNKFPWLENAIPFGIGKRTCLGERLARQELFILFVGLMQRFEVQESPEHPLPSLNVNTIGVTRPPPQFRVGFVERK